jgi:hypothetical protein
MLIRRTPDRDGTPPRTVPSLHAPITIAVAKRSNWDVNDDNDHEETIMDQQIVQNNTSRQRLRELVASLDEESYRRAIGADWTVAGLLAHLAFWDQACVVRWAEYDRTGSFINLSDETGELINTACRPGWLATPGPIAAELALQAAEMADARTASLSAPAIAYVTENDRSFILDRASHRHSHLDEIHRALGR